MNKKYKNINKFNINKYTLSMAKFITVYVDENLGECLGKKVTKITHKTLRIFDVPLVLSISFNYANEHPELIATGILLLVKDQKNNYGCYLNTDKLRKYVEFNNSENTIKNDEISKLEEELKEIIEKILVENGKTDYIRKQKNNLELGKKILLKIK